MAAKLIAEEGILKGLVLPLEEGNQWVIGRDPDACQLLLEDPAASRKHLLCRNTPEGIVLENLSKTNPVEVNNEELLNPRLLHDGDTVKIGSGMFRFFVDADLKMKDSQPVESEDSAEVMDDHESILEEGEEAEKLKLKGPEINFDLLETGRWLLKVIGGPNNGAEFSMQPAASYIIGTDPNSCDIVFHDTSVSRQHAKMTISSEDDISIEDLKSRNGVLVDGQKIDGKHELTTNTIVTMGTTSFVVYDREGNMQTIISPLLPSIVKVLQKEEPSKEEVLEPSKLATEGSPPLEAKPEDKKSQERHLGAFILIAIITGIFVLVGIGTTTLFYSEPVVAEQQANPEKLIDEALSSFTNVKHSFNKATGRLLIVGHVLTGQDKSQLLYNVQGLNFIKSLDDTGIIIDEYVWQEANLLLSKNPNWRGITIQSPSAGQFVLSGYLKTRSQAEQLYEYIAANFPYLDRLEKRVIVDENIISSVSNDLSKVGINNLAIQFQDGELTLKGGLPQGKQEEYNHVVEEFKKIPGVRSVRSLVNQVAPEQAMINISDKYEVTGFSKIGTNLSVVVNGRIVTKGDILDGMAIKEINPGTIFLEKEGIKYRIDFSK